MRSPTGHHVHLSLPNVHGHQQDLICSIVEPDIMEYLWDTFSIPFASSFKDAFFSNLTNKMADFGLATHD